MSKVAINSKTFPRCVLKRAKTASKQYENETEEEAARRQDPAVFGCCKTRFSEAHCAIDLILGRLSRFEPFDLTVLSKRERERAKERERERREREREERERERISPKPAADQRARAAQV